MIFQNHKKHFIYPAFAAILAIVLLAASDRIVKSQRAIETRPSPFQFKGLHVEGLPEPKRGVPNLISGPTSPGSLLEKRTTDFSSNEAAQAVAVQTDGKIVAAGWSGIVTYSDGTWTNTIDLDFAVFRYNVDGSLDTSFDGDGNVTTDFANGNDGAYAVAIQPDGKIIAAGFADVTTPNLSKAAVVRYNTDGSLDTSFGTGGKVVTEGHQGIYELAIQTDGKIVAAGYDFKIARYNTDGSLDASFGTGGIAWLNFGGAPDVAASVTLQADGKIVAAGESSNCSDFDPSCWSNFVLARFNADGSADASFDGDGKVITPLSGYYEWATTVAVQTDGKIIAAGHISSCVDESPCLFDFAVTRYNPDGSLDTSFDSDGIVTMDFGSDSEGASAVAIQSDGKVVVSGSAHSGPGNDFALLRLNIDGSLDNSFDTDGKVTTDFGNEEGSSDVAIQPNGKIIAVGYSDSGSNFNFALARYRIDGSLDAAFDGDGKVTTSFPDVSSAANAVVIDERPGYELETCHVGYINNGANDDFALATVGGRSTITPIGNSADRANAAARDSSSRIIAAGYSDNGSNLDFALVRYHSWLPIDTSFGDDGKVTTDFGGNEEATAVAVQADYRILVVGQTSAGGGAALVLVRYNSNGSLDTSFGAGGRVIVQSVQNPKAMAIQPDGKIIAAGNAPHTASPFGENFALARFHPDGSLDTSFDGDGIAVTRFDFTSQINSVALQPYGKIVAAGFTRNNTGTVSEFALARYNADGSPDTSFDADGKVTTSFGSAESSATSVGVQRNGKIVAVGFGVNNSTARDFALARYNGDGSLDTTFDTDGKQTTDFFGSDDVAFAAAIERDGNIVAAGSARRGTRYDFAAARYTGDATPKVPYDFDDDGLAELSVFRPSNGVWYLNRSTQGYYATQFGSSNDKIAPADYDGDGTTDIAVYRDGTWFLRTSRFSSPDPIQFGLPDDIPVPADYNDGDGRAELAIYRGGAWWSFNLRNNQVSVIQFGLPTDKPVPADYDGDGRADQAVYRNGEWHINGSSQGYTVIHFGLATDRPVAADYDGDGRSDLAVYRDGTWYLLQSTNGFTAFQWGISSDVPAPADYDGDGQTDPAVFRDGTWYLLQSSNGISIQQFGLPGDRPVPATYLP